MTPLTFPFALLITTTLIGLLVLLALAIQAGPRKTAKLVGKLLLIALLATATVIGVVLVVLCGFAVHVAGALAGAVILAYPLVVAIKALDVGYTVTFVQATAGLFIWFCFVKTRLSAGKRAK